MYVGDIKSGEVEYYDRLKIGSHSIDVIGIKETRKHSFHIMQGKISDVTAPSNLEQKPNKAQKNPIGLTSKEVVNSIKEDSDSSKYASLASAAEWKDLANVGTKKLDKGNSQYISSEEAKKMILNNNFFDALWNSKGTGIENHFSIIRVDSVISDYSVKLVWQKLGSSKPITYTDAVKFIDDLNRRKYAGYNNWRLPTLYEVPILK